MQKSCEFCGKPFNAQRAAARFCSDTCKKRRQRAGTPSLSLAPVNGDPESDDVPVVSGLVATTQRTLEDARVLETVPGQSALILAARIAAGNDTGAAISSMVEQLGKQVAAALALRESASWLDRVKEERDRVLRSVDTA